jgi:hypothetical protein
VSAARRILIIGGIALALWGMAYGLWYAVFVEHQTLDVIGGSLTSAFAAGAQRNDNAVLAAMNQYRETKYVYDRQVDVHSHWIGLAMLLIFLGICFDRVNWSPRIQLWLAIALLAGAVLFPLGVQMQVWSHGSLPRAVAIAGSALEIAALFLATLGFLRTSPPAAT